jgi:hypothetical protein
MRAARAIAKEHRQSSEWQAAGTSPVAELHGGQAATERRLVNRQRRLRKNAIRLLAKAIVELHTYNCSLTWHRPTSMRILLSPSCTCTIDQEPTRLRFLNAIVEEHHNHVLITHATRRAVYKTTADLGGD